MTQVPFFSNTPDDTHCLQAVIRMVAKLFWPDEEYNWEKLDRISGKEENLWTWPMEMTLWFQNRGVEVINEEIFDYDEFAKRGGEYLKEFYGTQAGEAQIVHSNIAKEQQRAALFTQKVSIHKKIPTIQEIFTLLDQGYVVCCNINSMTLNEKDGYVGHFVLMTDHDESSLTMHDPGLPPMPHRLVPLDLFEKAWGYPDEKTKNILALRLPIHIP